MLWCFDLFPFQGNDEKEGRKVDCGDDRLLLENVNLCRIFTDSKLLAANTAVGLYVFRVVEFPVGWTLSV